MIKIYFNFYILFKLTSLVKKNYKLNRFNLIKKIFISVKIKKLLNKKF
jgi:hypothetical protein